MGWKEHKKLTFSFKLALKKPHNSTPFTRTELCQCWVCSAFTGHKSPREGTTFHCSWDRGFQVLYKILILESLSINNKLIYMVGTEELGLSPDVGLALVALNRAEHFQGHNKQRNREVHIGKGVSSPLFHFSIVPNLTDVEKYPWVSRQIYQC